MILRRVGSTLIGLYALIVSSGGAAPPSQPPRDLADPALSAARVREGLVRGRYPEAEAAARRLLARARSVDATSLAAAEAIDLLIEVLIVEGFAGTSETRELAEAALSIKERALGRTDPGYGWTLALASVVDSDTMRCRERLERSLAIQEARPGAEPRRVAWTLHALGSACQGCPVRGRVAPPIERALRIRERVLGPNDPDTLRVRAHSVAYGDPTVCLETLTAMLGELEREGLADHPVAAELWRWMAHCHGSDPHSAHSTIRSDLEHALEIDVSQLGADSPLAAGDRIGLGMWHAAKMEFEIAGDHFGRARSALEKAFEPGNPRLLSLVGNEARYALGADLEGAGALLAQALALRERMYGRDCPAFVELGFEYALWLKDRGKCPEAREVLEPLVELLEQQPESPDLAWGLQYMGELAACTGDLARARTFFEESLALWERLAGPEALTLWVVLADLGDVNTRLGNHAIAESHLRRSIALQERELGPEYGGVGTGLLLLGKDYAARTEWPRAREVLERARKIAKLTFGATSKRTELVLRELCSVQLALGDTEDARESCRQALDIVVERHGAAHPYFADAAARLAAVRLVQGARKDSLAHAMQAEDAARNCFLRTARRLSEREALGLRQLTAAWHPGLDIALSIVSDPREVSENEVSSVWDRVVQSRALVLEEVAARHAVSLGAPARVREVVRRLDAARDVLSHLIVRSFDPDRQVEQREMEEASDTVDGTERELAATDLVFGESRARARAGLAEVLSALPPRTALVSYVKFRRIRSFAPLDRIPAYLAFVRSPGNPGVSVVDLGPAERIERTIEAWRDELDTPPSAVGRTGESAYVLAGEALRKAIWDPVHARISGADQVLVVPDGALNLVNFMALPSAPGRYVVEDDLMVHLLSAERDVAALSRPFVPGNGLLLVGAPAFDLDPRLVEIRELQTLSGLPETVAAAAVYRGPTPSCGSFGSRLLPPLPRALAEVEQVASLWSTTGGTDLTPVVKLVGEQAAEGAFKRLVRGRRVVHIATHGFFADVDCVASNSSPPIDRSLTIAGLAFAGADWRGEARPDQDDGILTADEVASLDLTHAEWIVVSACDSGIGRNVDGEGVLGLRRAFQTAGARTLVMSLWRVQDDAAGHWMARLYRARARHESTMSAVRSATLELLTTRRERGLDTHPYYWGAFVAAGDWR